MLIQFLVFKFHENPFRISQIVSCDMDGEHTVIAEVKRDNFASFL